MQAVASRADPLFAGDGYLTRDTLRVATEDLNLDNAASLLAGLENPSPDTVATRLASLHRRMNPPELRPLREVMLLWAQQVAKRRINLDLRMQDMLEVDRMRESDDVEAFFAARVEVWRNQYRAEGRAQGGARSCRGERAAMPSGSAAFRRRHGRTASGVARRRLRSGSIRRDTRGHLRADHASGIACTHHASATPRRRPKSRRHRLTSFRSVPAHPPGRSILRRQTSS